MAKIAKNSELSETAVKASLCEDPREALLEISTGKYDDHFYRLAKIYFADVYKNTNELDMDGKHIREKFLTDFDFRKALIEFGKKKGLGIENGAMRNTMTHEMHFEGESINDMKKKYTSTIKETFFSEKKTDEKAVPQMDDPILSLLKKDDKKKVILSQRYQGEMKTFTKLITILSLTDEAQQKDILTYLASEEFKASASLLQVKELIDVMGDDALEDITNWAIRKKDFNHKEDLRSDIIAHLITKKSIQKFSPQLVSRLIDRIKPTLINRRWDNERVKQKDFVRFLVNFVRGVDVGPAPMEEELFYVLKKCFLFLGKHGIAIEDGYQESKKKDFAIIENEFAQAAKNDSQVQNGITFYKQSTKEVIEK